MRKLSSIRFANVPKLPYISFQRGTCDAPASPFVFPVLTNFLYCQPIAQSMLQQACMPRIIQDRHPNDWYQDSEYGGHVVHEVPDIKKDIERLKADVGNNY